MEGCGAGDDFEFGFIRRGREGEAEGSYDWLLFVKFMVMRGGKERRGVLEFSK